VRHEFEAAVRSQLPENKTFNTGDTGDHGLEHEPCGLVRSLVLMKFDLTGGGKDGSNVIRGYTH
jgi:hypothetical protein